MALKERPRELWYAGYITAAVLVLLYVFFPQEALRSYVGQRLSAALPGLSVAIREIGLSLPAAVMLKDVEIRHGGRPVLTIERLRIVPQISSWLKENGRYTFSGSAGGGEIKGAAETEAGGGAMLAGLNARLEGAQLERIAALQTFYGSRLTGRLTIELASKEAGALSGKVAITEAQVELDKPLFDQKSLTFRTVDADLNLQNRNLVVRGGRLRGNELDAEVSGTIALDPEADRSTLNLSGRVTPHQTLVARIEGSLPPNFLRRRGGLAFKLTGSLAEPGFSLN